MLILMKNIGKNYISELNSDSYLFAFLFVFSTYCQELWRSWDFSLLSS